MPSKKGDKPNFLVTWFGKEIEISRKKLGSLALLFLGAGALITIVSLEAGAILIAFMILLVGANILWEVFG